MVAVTGVKIACSWQARARLSCWSASTSPSQHSLGRKRIAALAELTFIVLAEDVHLFGPPGAGKRDRATALAVEAIDARRGVVFSTPKRIPSDPKLDECEVKPELCFRELRAPFASRSVRREAADRRHCRTRCHRRERGTLLRAPPALHVQAHMPGWRCNLSSRALSFKGP